MVKGKPYKFPASEAHNYPRCYIVYNYEVAPLFKLFNAVELNTTAGAGMDPNPENSYCRLPKPEVLAQKVAVPEKHKDQPELCLCYRLPIYFSTTIAQLDQCRLYDGSPTS
jgi:hypothetical protein